MDKNVCTPKNLHPWGMTYPTELYWTMSMDNNWQMSPVYNGIHCTEYSLADLNTQYTVLYSHRGQWLHEEPSTRIQQQQWQTCSPRTEWVNPAQPLSLTVLSNEADFQVIRNYIASLAELSGISGYINQPTLKSYSITKKFSFFNPSFHALIQDHRSTIKILKALTLGLKWEQ